MSPKSNQPGKKPEHSHVVPQNKGYAISKSNQHVMRRDDGWVVRGAGQSRDTVKALTQREAIERAREIAKATGAEVIVHDRDGNIAGREVFRVNDWELEPLDTLGNKYVDASLYGNRPHVRGRRVLVSMIAANYDENQWSVARMAEEFSLSEEEVLAALLYYREHKEEIDQQDAEEQKLFDEMHRLHGKHT